MKDILAIITQKGGTGKTSTAAAVGAGLKRRGNSVLLIDLDPQCNLSTTLGASCDGLTVYDVLTRKLPAVKAIQETTEGAVIAASPALSGADMIINQTGKEYRLREALEPLKALYDFIIIDTPPALGVLTVNALTACRSVIIPAQADVYSLQGIRQLYDTLNTVKQYCNPGLTVKGIVLTRYSPRSVLSREMRDVIEQTAQQYGTQLFSAYIRENIAIREAQASQSNIFDYAPKSNAAADYNALIDEIM